MNGRNRLFVMCMVLVTFVVSCFGTTLASEASASPKIMRDTDRVRVVEMIDGDLFYKSTFDKKEQILISEVYEDGICIDYHVFSLGQLALEAECRMNNRIITPTQSETGFGYVEGDPISSYACSQKLVDNGTFPCRGINIYNSVNSNAQQSFKSKVNELISIESDIEDLLGKAEIYTVVTLILYGIGSAAGAAANIVALGYAADAEGKALRADKVANECASIFSQLLPYKI